MNIFSGSSDIPKIILIIACASGMILFLFLTPPVADSVLFEKIPLLSSLPYDFSVYAGRFLFSFLFLGLIPFCTALLLKYRPKDIGIRLPELKNRKLFFTVLSASAVLLGILSSLDTSIAGFYPYSRFFPELMQKYGFAVILIHPAAYFIFFYVPWEIMFRGILIFPFIGNNKFYAAACMQAIPSALLHFGHPFSEFLSALFFGIFAGIITVKTKSIIPALLFHAVLGITLDLTLILKAV